MQAVVLNGPNEFGWAEVERPHIGADELLIQMKKAAFCGTDIRILEGKKTKDVRYPSVIGHEMSGVIVEAGSNVKGYSVGDRVAIANVIPCGNCASCRDGMENACLNRMALGYQYDGAFQEYIRIPGDCIAAGNVVKLSSNVSFTAGALIEPLACCIRGMRNAGIGFNDVVLIVGAGPIGLMHLQLAKQAGASKVIVSDPNSFRCSKAAALGADIVVNPNEEDLTAITMDATGGAGVDVVMLAIGIPPLVNGLLKLCRRGGTVCLFAGFAGAGEGSIEMNLIHYNELHVCGSTAYKRSDYLDAAAMVSAGRIDLDAIATHCFKLKDFLTAYETCKAGSGLKIMLEP